MVLRMFGFVIKWCKVEVREGRAILQGHKHPANGLNDYGVMFPLCFPLVLMHVLWQGIIWHL